MSSLIAEFKDFLLKGNLIEVAVAFVMALAFAAVVNSFVVSLVLPLVSMIFGERDFSDLSFTINDAEFRYGAFLTSLIQFVAVAAAIFFFVVKPVDLALAARRGREAEEEAPSDDERRHQELLAALRAR